MPVTPFAAGCAVCGADLEAHRRRQAERRERLAPVRPPALPRVSLDPDVGAVALCAVGAVLFPVLALLFVFFFVRDPMRANVRIPLSACAALAVVFLAVPPLRFGLLGLL